ncbi:MAG: anaerobic ribonucleoside-triphosphate reductase activating protein [Nanoarchaeota archaeon]|nr:anaerobic ribonucleoside-triphosphate reductase activating protein [Nanoarchaeota archaeon]
MSLKIKHLEKTSLVDYPGKISCVLFLGGCNFRCGYCHNKQLILDDELKNINEEEILSYLESRKKWIDGVVFTGGEPLLYNLKDFIIKIKNLGFLIKLDTNGFNPDALKELIDNNLLDYIAMDIKNSFEKYEETVGTKVDLDKIKESINLIKNFKNYEFRMTVLPLLHNEGDFESIGNLLEGCKLFCIQQFRPMNCLNEDFESEKQFSLKELEIFKKILENYVKKVEMRNL